jgi:primosomal protein N' (replication factor Y)
MPETRYLQIAIPTPLQRVFDYLPPAGLTAPEIERLAAGIRIAVPFGHQQVTGVLLGVSAHTELQSAQLRQAQAILDDTPVLPGELLNLGRWAADYYQCPLGEALHTALPVLEKFGFSATVFVVGGMLDAPRSRHKAEPLRLSARR